MKKLSLLYILLITLLYGDSKEFSLIVKQPFDAAIFDITQDYDRAITAVGFSKSFDENAQKSTSFTNAFDYLSSISNKYGSQMHIIKVDESLNTLFSKALRLSNFSEAVSVHKTPQNGYIVGGHTVDGELIIVELDSSAKILRSQTFGTKNSDTMSRLVYLRDGGVLALGSSTTSRSHSDPLFERGLGQSDIFITRFSKSGEKLWSKKHGTSHDDMGVDALEATDGSIILAATSSYDKHKEVTLMRLDENGNKIWLKHIKSDFLIVPKRVISLKDGSFLLSITEYTQEHKETIRLIKFDLHKNTLLDKYIYTTYPSALNDIAEFADQSLVGVGYVRDGHNSDGLAMFLTSELDMLTQEHYGEDNHDRFNTLKILHNSQIAVAGIFRANDSQESNMWITKLNRDGSMAQISQVSQNSSDFYKRLLRHFRDEIERKELHIRQDLTIELTARGLYFEQGVYKLTQAQKLFLEKFSKKLFTFLLNNRSLIKQLKINGHTSSEWNTTDFSKRYLKNAKLSMERSFATMSYIFSLQTLEIQEWLSTLLQGSGFSYSKKVMLNEAEERELSRRVTFKIILE